MELDILLISTYILISTILTIVFTKKYLQEKNTTTLLSIAIVTWSGLIYTNHFFNVLPLNTMYYYDWIVTTPLLVLLLATTTNSINQKAITTAFLQFLVILTGIIAVNNSDNQLFWFGLGCVLLLKVLYNLYAIGKKTIKKNIALYIIFFSTWIAYPIIWYNVDGMLSMATTYLVIIPLISKHVFTVIKEYKLFQ